MKNCNQCASMIINGVFCHERGCPNASKVWDPMTETWNKYRTCFWCGDQVLDGEGCDCMEPMMIGDT